MLDLRALMDDWVLSLESLLNGMTEEEFNYSVVKLESLCPYTLFIKISMENSSTGKSRNQYREYLIWKIPTPEEEVLSITLRGNIYDFL